MQSSRRLSLSLVTFVTVACLGSVPAYADFTALTSSDQVNGTLFDFDSLSAGFVTDLTNTVTSAAGFYFADLPAAPDLSGEFIQSSFNNGYVLDVFGDALGFDGRVTFGFNELVYGVGIDYNSSTQLSLVAFDINGNEINADGSIQTASDGGIGFFGIASSIGIGSIVIHDSLGTFSLDNLRFTSQINAVPIPGALSMAGLGLFLVGWVRRRR